jgi:predicted nucleotide-binding protein
MAKRSDDGSIQRAEMESFLRSVPGLSAVTSAPELLLEPFGFYLADRIGVRNITPRKVRACYDAAAVKAPSNIPYEMKKSKAFLKTADGTTISREVRSRFESLLSCRHNAAAVSPSAATPSCGTDKSRNVVVIYGRDKVVRESMYQFLRALRLNPIEWSEAVSWTGQGSPYTGEVLDALFRDAQAFVIILSPDEYVELREDLKGPGSDDDHGWQPRPNVLFEAGMAFAKDQKHTIVVQIGRVRGASDLFGRNLIDLDGSGPHRNALVKRLRDAGCPADTAATDWLSTGKFKIPSRAFKGRRRK